MGRAGGEEGGGGAVWVGRPLGYVVRLAVPETVFRICRYIASVRGMTLAFSDPMVMRISHMASLLSSLSKAESQAELKCHMLMLYFFPIIVTEVYPSHGRSPNWVRFVHPHHHPLLTEESLIAFLAHLPCVKLEASWEIQMLKVYLHIISFSDINFTTATQRICSLLGYVDLQLHPRVDLNSALECIVVVDRGDRGGSQV